MINIYFSPDYYGDCYIDPLLHEGVMMNTYIVNTSSLVALLESRCGIFNEVSPYDRLTTYHKAVKNYVFNNKGCLMESSFSTSELSTATQLLNWRDKLIDAGWKPEMKVSSKRLRFIAEIEKTLNASDKHMLVTLAQRADKVITLVPQLSNWLRGGIIHIPFNRECMPPLSNRLLDALASQGCTILVFTTATGNADSNLQFVKSLLVARESDGKKVPMPNKDDTFQIWQFRTEHDELEYLTSLEDSEFDLWICKDRMNMDSWLDMADKPTVGSEIQDSNPQIAQLLNIGIGLFSHPLNIKTRLQWLAAPKSPLNYQLRHSLTRAIRKSGGYNNKECEEAIKEYLETIKGENEKKIEKLRNEEEKKIKLLLPEPVKDGVDVKQLREFVSHVTQWANKAIQGAISGDEKFAMDAQTMQQMENLLTHGNTFSRVLSSENRDFVDYITVEKWIKDIYEPDTYIHRTAQKGCRMTVSSPGHIIDNPKKTIWINCYQSDQTHLSTDFLHASELSELKNCGCTFWDADREREYNMSVMLLPLMQSTEQVILSCIGMKEGQKVEKHPLLIRLENSVENLPVVTPVNGNKEDVEKVDNSHCKDSEHLDVVKIDNKDLLNWRDKESYSSLTTLIEHPIDYTFEHLLHINDGGRIDFENVERTKGEVAHGVIEALFHPDDEDNPISADEIQKQVMSDYDAVFKEQVEEKGAILMLLEHETETKQFKDQLRKVLGKLLSVLSDNDFRVKSCELELTGKLGFRKSEDIEIHGFVDMIVVDASDQPSIIDFKWSASGGKIYKGNIEKNRSLQLALYDHLVSQTECNKIKHTGYFIMPEGCLYTHAHLKGKNVKHYDSDGRDVFKEIINSYNYRREQISNGEIEFADGMKIENVQYFKDLDDKQLLPVYYNEKDNTLGDNQFSKIKTLTKGAK